MPDTPSARPGLGTRSSSRPPVFLTGASGFIGARIARRLLAGGCPVRALVRAGSSRADRLDPRIETVYGTLGDDAALRRGLAGAAAVINCAGAVRGNGAADFAPANVDGVRTLCEAVDSQSNKPAVLHLSSLAAEEPGLSAYASSKRDGERVLEAFDELLWTVFRPPAVYGPGDVEMRGAFAWARRGLVPVAGGNLDQRLSMLHVDDLASAVVAWLENPSRHRHKTYAIDDGHEDGYD